MLLPLFLLSALGYLMAKSRWLHAGWANGVNELTSKLLIPALLLSGAYRNGLSASGSWQLLCAYYLPFVLIFLLVAFGFKRNEHSAPRALACTYSNGAFVGIPVLVQAFGNDSLQFGFPIIALHSLIGFTLYYLVTPGEGSGAGRIARSLLSALKNPIVASLLIGFALKLAGIALPAFATQILAMLSAAAMPCALLALGASLAGFTLQSRGEALLVVFSKLFVLPAAVLAMALQVFHLPIPAVSVLVLLASCPVGINAAAVVQGDGKNPVLASSAILLSSIACMATMPMWLWVMSRV